MPPRPRNRAPTSNSAAPNKSSTNSGGDKSTSGNSKNNGKGKGKGDTQSNKSNTRRKQPISTLVPQPTNEDPATLCTVCATKALDWALGPCCHVVCGDCAHRMRVLYRRETCVICSQPQKHIVVVPIAQWRESMTYEDAVALPSLIRDQEINMSFLDRTRLAHFQHVRGWMCSNKSCVKKAPDEKLFNNGTQLRAHARSEHRALYCEICFTGQKSFVSELQQFSLDPNRNFSGSLRSHLRKNHPQCRFCRQYYLDDDKLYAHLQEAHETCSICERNGRIHEYYVNFTELERHYAKEHFTCSHESCRGVVFATAIELQAHLHAHHSSSTSNTTGGRGRALRVNLQQLHEGRDPRAADDVAVERERQAARRRAFLSSHVVFSGAFNFNDGGEDAPEQTSASAPPSASAGPSSIPSIQPVSSIPAPPDNDGATPHEQQTAPSTSSAQPRPPDDGHFHPSRLPSTPEDSAARNTALVRRMRQLLDPAGYEQFKLSSAQFQDGTIDTNAYYNAAVDAFGVRAAVRDILPELVALLPSPLLREPLLRTCLRRTDTRFTEADLDPSVSALASLSVRSPAETSGSGSTPNDEQFPTLDGGPPPPQSRVPTRGRRFGDLGPEQFPRLTKVNRAGLRPTPAAPAPPTVSNRRNGSNTTATTTPAESAPVLARSAPPSTPRTSTPTPKTAASVLRQGGPASVRVFGNRSSLAGGPIGNRGSGSGGGARFDADAFPSLGANTAAHAATPTRGFVGAVARTSNTAEQAAGTETTASSSTASTAKAGPRGGSTSRPALSENAFPPLSVGDTNAFPSLAYTETVADEERNLESNESDTPTADLSLRAGAVWGGAARNVRGGERGQGQGRKRRPATPPRAALQRLTERNSDEGFNTEAGTAESPNATGLDSRASNSSGRKLKVIDVMEIARERQRAIERSSLPRFAKSAYSVRSSGKKPHS